VVKPDGTVIKYYHNANNQRTAKEVNGTVTEKYLWKDLTTLLAVYNADDTLRTRFEYADGRMPYKMTHNGQAYYLAYDQVGSLRTVSTENGTIVKTIEYDTFGNVLSDSNETLAVPFGFAGGLYDPDTKMTRFGYRDYDAETGKWTAKDPIGFNGGDTNLYGYVLGDPVDWIDPSGLDRSLSQSISLLWQKFQNGTISNSLYQAYCGLAYNGLPKMWQNTPWYAKLPLVHALGISGYGAYNASILGYGYYLHNASYVHNVIQGATTQTPNINSIGQYTGYIGRKIFDNLFGN
jgi:RHS repeat-associated protein